MSMSNIRVLIVEDHSATLEGLSIGLSRDPALQVVGTSENSDEGLSLAADLKPDVIVLDLHLPGAMSPKTMVETYAQKSAAKLIIYSAESRLALVQSALHMGVAAYLLKSERVTMLAEVIKQVYGGATGIMSQTLGTESSKVTKAEEEILSMLANGLRYQEIGDKRFTSPATVRKQCDTLILKLGLDSREQLIAWAVRNGYGTLGAKV
ncbi:MAG TPA: response regulator transcription factor [Oculatellaceae cyanobacterium]